MLEGNLTDFTLPDVLRLLAFTTKTGRLALHDGDALGRVDLVDGHVRGASADARHVPLGRRVLGAGLVDDDALLAALAEFDQLPTDHALARVLVTEGGVEAAPVAELLREQTYDAVFDLLRWPRGGFRFEADPDATRDGTVLDLALPVDELLTETARRLEAWESLATRTGQRSDVVSLRGPASGAGEVTVPADGWALLSLVDGRRTVADLVMLAGQGEQRTRRVIAGLLDAEVIRIGPPDDQDPTERLLRAHEALTARERELHGGPALDAGEPTPVADSPADAPSADSPSADAPAEAPPTDDPAPKPAAGADAATAARSGERGRSPQPLQTKVRNDRLRTDPAVDEDLVSRLIEGVEGL